MNKIVKIVLAVIGVVAAIMWYNLPSRDVPVSEAIENGAMNTMFMLMYLLLGVAVAASVLFAIRAYFSNPKSLKKTLMLVVGFLVVVAIAKWIPFVLNILGVLDAQVQRYIFEWG